MQVRYQLRHRPALTSVAGDNSTRLLHFRRLHGRLRGREIDRDDRRVLPETLERVVLTVLLMEDVHDEIAEVEQHPTALAAPLATQRLRARLEERILDAARDREHVALVVARREQECVGQRQRPGHVERDEILGLLVVGSARGYAYELTGTVGCGHRLFRVRVRGVGVWGVTVTGVSSARPA